MCISLGIVVLLIHSLLPEIIPLTPCLSPVPRYSYNHNYIQARHFCAACLFPIKLAPQLDYIVIQLAPPVFPPHDHDGNLGHNSKYVE